MSFANNENRVYIGLGSNLGDSPQNLFKAIQLLQEHLGIPVTPSSVYFSEPVEVREQPWFYNQAVYFEDNRNDSTPIQLLKVLQKIEQDMGRVRTYRFGPRIIDLDLLLFKNWVMDCEFLTIPHPKISERRFVLEPLIELEPQMIHPRINLSMREILANNSSKLSRCEKLSSQSTGNQAYFNL